MSQATVKAAIDTSLAREAWSVVAQAPSALAALSQTWMMGIDQNVTVNDALIRNMIWSLIMWCFAAWTGWFAARRNAMLALLPGIGLLAVILSYSEYMIYALWTMVIMLLLLMGLWNYKNHTVQWERRRVDYSDSIVYDNAQAVVFLALLIGTVAFSIPSLSWRDIRDAIRDRNKNEAAEMLGIKETTSRGGKSAWSPREEKDDFGIYRTSAIYTYGETLHVFVDRDDYKGAFAPTYKPIQYEAESTGLAAIDHIVGNVQLGKMNHWVNFYHLVMGFRQLAHFDDKDISTEYSALMSKVMQNGNGRVKFPINEPAEGRRKSQIEEYLDYYLTPGAQHVALITGDILKTVEQLRKRGVEFLRVPVLAAGSHDGVVFLFSVDKLRGPERTKQEYALCGEVLAHLGRPPGSAGEAVEV